MVALRIERGRYVVRLAETEADIAAAQALRGRCFRGEGMRDADEFDARARHFLIETRDEGALAGCFRALVLAGETGPEHSYSAQYYDLSALASGSGPWCELGRFCVAPEWTDPDILRLGWAALARLVDGVGARGLIGCSSFSGTDWRAYQDAFALLAARHLAPALLRPGRRAPETVAYPEMVTARPLDLRAAQAQMPPLLRTYLSMGGWVSDHAVIDRDLGTLHVFTAIDIAAIPPARARALRELAG